MADQIECGCCGELFEPEREYDDWCEECVESHDPGDDYFDDRDDDNYLIDGVGFADPGGTSSLRAATRSNPRNLPCPTCGEPNRLTPIDVAHGYQCNVCASRADGTYVGADY